MGELLSAIAPHSVEIQIMNGFARNAKQFDKIAGNGHLILRTFAIWRLY